ncbi:MAG TPA: ribonuclease III [Gammaproteobacteria bacterium]|nr:ribonuclease III [Gammaproteobacteria bacterium]
MSDAACSELSHQLEYRFSNEQLLAQALTHRSKHHENYERLEFLGDSVLGIIVSEALYQRFPQVAEGKLSRMRASLVCGRSLSEISRSLGLGHYVLLGAGELKSGGFDRNSILADLLEAVIGAMYLDGGWDQVRSFVLRILQQKILNIHSDTDLRDAKTRLQEWLQQQNLALPVYRVITTSGQDHCKEFVVVCSIDKAHDFTGRGRSRRYAEQHAATLALQFCIPEPAIPMSR